MNTPRYVVQRIGDEYQFRRVDGGPSVSSNTAIIGGAVLAMVGLSSRSWVGAGIGIAGAGLIYYGLTGRNPLDDLMPSHIGRASDPGPSHLHDAKSGSHQRPSDAVDEAAMESFPASDPPAHGGAS